MRSSIKRNCVLGIIALFFSLLVPRAQAQGSPYQFTTVGAFSTYSPDSVVVDSTGNFFVAVPANNVILKITPGGTVSTFAGSGSGLFVNGTGTAASFSFPHEIAIDSSDNLYVADSNNHAIRKITPAAVVTTFAGGTLGQSNGNGTSAQFQNPWGVTVDASGNLYVADTYNNEIRKINPAGDVTTLAGSTTGGHADGTGASSTFLHPSSVAVDSAGNLYVADYSNQIIRKVTPAGVVTTLAGAYAATGYVEGVGAAARFAGPQGVAVDRLGNVYVADSFNNVIRKITPNGTVSTFAGAAAAGSADGDSATVRFDTPEGIAIDATGNIYVADTGNNSIRKGTSIAPSFTTQPVGQSLVVSSSVTFTAAATGTAPLTYQWKKGGIAISGATNSSYNIAAVGFADAGDYTVVASNLADSVTSNVATLTVNAVAPTITTQPATQSVVDGSSVTFSVVATGTAPLSYQWKKAGTAISGAVASTYTIAVATTVDAGDYTVVVSNSAGPVTSNIATLTVTAIVPSISTQPVGQSVVVGSPASFSVIASGTAPLSYQWQRGGVAISGATASTYSIASVGLGDAGDYTVVVSNSAGPVTSNIATLSVSSVGVVPTITTQPLSFAVFAGTSATLTAAASGTPTPTYQWQKNGINISGATGTTLNLTNIQVSDAGSYALIATNSAGSVASHFAQLVVIVARPNAITYEAKAYPSAVTVGGNVSVEYLLTNTGTMNWGADHYLSIRDGNGTYVAFAPLIGAHAGDNKKVNLSFPAPATPGTYTYTVQALQNGVEFFTTQTTLTIDVLPVQANGITYNVTNFPISSTPGTTLIFNYNVTNTGTKTWGTNHVLSLRNSAGIYLAFSSLNGVAPGQSKTVNMSLTAPSAPGVYSYVVQAVENGVEFFPAQANLTLTVLAPQPDAVVYTPTRLQGDVTPGATVNLRYALSNAGTVAWGPKHYASLRDGNGTFLAFVPLSGVAPGGSTTVNFSFTAPSTAGPYVYYVQALEDGVQFFDNQDLVPLNVVETPVGNAATYGANTFPITAAPGAVVDFTDQITNRGTRTWGANHFLSLRDADSIYLGFPTISGIAPGGSKTVNFTFTAPASAGVYTYHVQAMESGVEFFLESDDLVLIVQ